jgi:hypothetical protein
MGSVSYICRAAQALMQEALQMPCLHACFVRFDCLERAPLARSLVLEALLAGRHLRLLCHNCVGVCRCLMRPWARQQHVAVVLCGKVCLTRDGDRGAGGRMQRTSHRCSGVAGRSCGPQGSHSLVACVGRQANSICNVFACVGCQANSMCCQANSMCCQALLREACVDVLQLM